MAVVGNWTDELDKEELSVFAEFFAWIREEDKREDATKDKRGRGASKVRSE